MALRLRSSMIAAVLAILMAGTQPICACAFDDPAPPADSHHGSMPGPAAMDMDCDHGQAPEQQDCPGCVDCAAITALEVDGQIALLAGAPAFEPFLAADASVWPRPPGIRSTALTLDHGPPVGPALTPVLLHNQLRL